MRDDRNTASRELDVFAEISKAARRPQWLSRPTTTSTNHPSDRIDHTRDSSPSISRTSSNHTNRQRNDLNIYDRSASRRYKLQHDSCTLECHSPHITKPVYINNCLPQSLENPVSHRTFPEHLVICTPIIKPGTCTKHQKQRVDTGNADSMFNKSSSFWSICSMNAIEAPMISFREYNHNNLDGLYESHNQAHPEFFEQPQMESPEYLSSTSHIYKKKAFINDPLNDGIECILPPPSLDVNQTTTYEPLNNRTILTKMLVGKTRDHNIYLQDINDGNIFLVEPINKIEVTPVLKNSKKNRSDEQHCDIARMNQNPQGFKQVYEHKVQTMRNNFMIKELNRSVDDNLFTENESSNHRNIGSCCLLASQKEANHKYCGTKDSTEPRNMTTTCHKTIKMNKIVLKNPCTDRHLHQQKNHDRFGPLPPKINKNDFCESIWSTETDESDEYNTKEPPLNSLFTSENIDRSNIAQIETSLQLECHIKSVELRLLEKQIQVNHMKWGNGVLDNARDKNSTSSRTSVC
eukprot:GHVL01010118.1.p1 GENE.GHVL01010118.1~~GHVL01010118.1.p1  ORF type:complete len:578 (+),score=61.64 GHVL01010118.1:177-1736(+)